MLMVIFRQLNKNYNLCGNKCFHFDVDPVLDGKHFDRIDSLERLCIYLNPCTPICNASRLNSSFPCIYCALLKISSGMPSLI